MAHIEVKGQPTSSSSETSSKARGCSKSNMLATSAASYAGLRTSSSSSEALLMPSRMSSSPRLRLLASASRAARRRASLTFSAGMQ